MTALQTMRKLRLLFIIFVLFPLRLLAQEIRVGAILPLSGAAADYGFGISKSIELTLIHHPDCAKRVKFIFEDAQHDPMQAVRAYNKLRTQDKVDLVYTFGVSFCQALAPLADQNRLPTLGQCIDPSASRGRTYFARFQNYTDEYMKVQLEYLASHNVKRIVLLVAEHAYVDALSEAIDRNLQPGQVIIRKESFTTTEQDFRSAILKAKNDAPDAVGVLLLNGQYGPFGRQAQELRLTVPMFGSNVLEGASELESTAGTLTGMTLAGHPLSQFFVESFTSYAGKLSQASFASLAYEFTTTLCEAVRNNSGNDLFMALQKTPIAGLATGPCDWTNSDFAGTYTRCGLEVKVIDGIKLKAIR